MGVLHCGVEVFEKRGEKGLKKRKRNGKMKTNEEKQK